MIPIAELLGLYAPVVLASASPRRQQLLAQIGLEFSVQPSNVAEEHLSTEIPPEEYVQTLALHKARDVAARISTPSLVLGADTIVVLSQKILNKPADESEAKEMLSRLSGNTHSVFTGIAIVDSQSGRYHQTFQQTRVRFRELSEREILAYIATGSPLDKAGAYGIQDDFGAVFIQEIQGCYYNVVGLPLELLYRTLQDFCR